MALEVLMTMPVAGWAVRGAAATMGGACTTGAGAATGAGAWVAGACAAGGGDVELQAASTAAAVMTTGVSGRRNGRYFMLIPSKGWMPANRQRDSLPK